MVSRRDSTERKRGTINVSGKRTATVFVLTMNPSADAAGRKGAARGDG